LVLRVDAERPALCLLEYDAVLDREVVVGEFVHGLPILDQDLVADYVNQIHIV